MLACALPSSGTVAWLVSALVLQVVFLVAEFLLFISGSLFGLCQLARLQTPAAMLQVSRHPCCVAWALKPACMRTKSACALNLLNTKNLENAHACAHHKSP